ncbi:MAG TPA: decaprenyl-phosphate phosphoribosyltransferase [Gammaproteobacteria bacterium]|nr:decaprenyl-phosphate phosphoribosyltransferase [Gammaproteobacteria bacterium]
MYPFIKLLRPHQWIKNIFVLAGIIFANAWNQPQIVISVLLATAAFCLMSSAVYIYNDIVDLELDSLHPTKKHRPLSSKKISLTTAVLILVVLFVSASGLGFLVSWQAGVILLGYFGLNLAYSHRLKHIVILDVFAISMGFMLRLLAGTVGVGIVPSQWLMFCGLMITLFLGFTKRRAEGKLMGHDLHFTRAILKDYNQIFLDKMIGITASCSIIGYGLYTMSDKTVLAHHTQNLIYTIPFVVYGIFRYLYLLHRERENSGEDMAKDLVRDKHLLITFVLWLGFTLFLI